MQRGNSNSNLTIIAVALYSNAERDKYLVYKENRGKSGIYRLNNLITGSFYIGSAVNLTKRMTNYYSSNFLKKELRRNSSIISSSLLKYGYSNFSIEILEYCDLEFLIKREQYYLDLLKPDYNILMTAGSRLGSKHSPETLLKFKTRKLSPEALANLKLAKAGKAPLSALRKINHLLVTGHITTVVNNKDNSVKSYDSVREAARDINVNHVTLLNYIKSGKLLKGIYLITKKKEIKTFFTIL